MIVYAFDKAGGFIAADTETRRTCYSYPTSTNATKARKAPLDVAQRVMEHEARYAGAVDPKLAAEYDARNWQKLRELGAAQ